DGKHSAAIEAYAPDKSRLERRQALLFVDSNPPIIELVEPRDSFPRTAFSMLFAIKDMEGGSGVPTDRGAADLTVEAGGVKVMSKAFVFKNNARHLLVMLEFEKERAPPYYPFDITVSLKDRAGNKGLYTREFKTFGQSATNYIRLCKEQKNCIKSEGAFLVYPQHNGLILQVAQSTPITFFTLSNYPKDFTYPPVCSYAHKEGRTAPEFTTLNDFFQKEIGRRIEITGSPDAISIEKREDKNLS
ncbi:MAG: hypothetical protein GY697_17925, partial [Desulfobacterales bacterium]|nr:hypothetical protein [Desulfobacterales bacterium]